MCQNFENGITGLTHPIFDIDPYSNCNTSLHVCARTCIHTVQRKPAYILLYLRFPQLQGWFPHVCLICWISDTLSQGYTDLQSLLKCLDHRGVVLVLDTTLRMYTHVLDCIFVEHAHTFIFSMTRLAMCDLQGLDTGVIL